ncbi:MAG: leucine-rich repeat protein [Lachnospiraceae bacterium]|nr:leucine-rich repeat protein [Lachnospiraceae bacterium]
MGSKKHYGKSIRSMTRRLLAWVLIATMMSQTFVYADGPGGGAGNGRPGAAMGSGLAVFDGLDAFGNTTATIGCILNVGSVLANGDWEHPETVALGLIDTIFGTSFSGDPTADKIDAIYNDISEMKETLNDVKKGVDYLVENAQHVNRMLDTINNSLVNVNHKLDRQTQMLSEIKTSLKAMNEEMTASFANLHKVIDDQTKTIKTTIYDSTIEIEKTNELNEILTNFVNDYSKLYSVEQNILETLSIMQSDYEAFYAAIEKLDNGQQVLEALRKLSLEENAIEKLGAEDQKLLKNTTVTVGSKKYNVLKYHQDYMEDLIRLLTSGSERSVYTLNNSVGNIGDTARSMGDYLLAKNATFNALTNNRGIGELYYLYCTYTEKDSETVHRKYKAFMDCMVAQYMTTAWLAEMAYGYKISEEARGNNNATTINAYEEYLYKINAQMTQVTAYYDYEYQKCINLYDFGSYKVDDKNGNMVYYGNTKNAYEYSVVPKNKVYSQSGISETSLELALGEQHKLYYYFRMADVSGRKGMVWESSDPKVCVVDHEGNLLALSRGVAKITATYAGNTAEKKECLVSIGDVMAVANGSEQSRYFYYTYDKKGGSWVALDTSYDVDAQKGYDYYYAVTTYRGDKLTLSDSNRSASLIEATGLTDANMKSYQWVMAGDQAFDFNGYDVSAVTEGWGVAMGYRQDQKHHTYEYIGIPVQSTMTSVFTDESKNFSDYEKISSAEDLIALSKDPSKWGPDHKYVLTSDIDLGGMEWTPIGYNYMVGSRSSNDSYVFGPSIGTTKHWEINAPFSGTFDGNGHTIRNFKITEIPYTDAMKKVANENFNQSDNMDSSLCGITIGLFGYIYNGVVTDLNVKNAVIDINLNKTDIMDGISVTKKGSDGSAGTEQELTLGKDFGIYAGVLSGVSRNDAQGMAMKKIMNYMDFANPPETPAEMEAVCQQLDDIYEFPAYFAGIREAAIDQALEDAEKENKILTEEEKYAAGMQAYLYTIMVYLIYKGADEIGYISSEGCNAKGEISIKGTGNEEICAGMLFGLSGLNISDSVCDGGIQTENIKEGAIGGLVGQYLPDPGSYVKDCTSKVRLVANKDVTVGGLIGETVQNTAYDLGVFRLGEDETDYKLAYAKVGIGVIFIAFGTGLGSVPPVTFDETAETNNPQIIGNRVESQRVAGYGIVGGLIGKKAGIGNTILDIVFNENEVEDEADTDSLLGPFSSVDRMINLDVKENYVNANIGSENGTSGGIIGYVDSKDREDMYDTTESKDGKPNPDYLKRKYPVTDGCKGKIERNLFFGTLIGKTAAGMVGDIKDGGFDFSILSSNVNGVYRITADEYAPFVNHAGRGLDEKMDQSSVPGIAFAETSFGNETVKGGIYYSGANLIGTKVNDGSTGMSADVFDDPATYQKLLGDNCFVDTSKLDIVDGDVAVHKKAQAYKYSFPLERALKVYYEGDAFKPLGQVYAYSDAETKLITTGVSSTIPDMTRVGVQTITVTYQNESTSYDIMVYPKSGYLTIDQAPKVQKDGSLEGGSLSLHENGKVVKSGIKLSETKVTNPVNYVYNIKYGNYTTAYRPVIVCVYANDFNAPCATLVDYGFYGQGSTLVTKELVPETLEAQGVYGELVGVSETKDQIVAENDVCLLAMYQVKDKSSGSGNENPGGGNDSGEETGKDDGSGKDSAKDLKAEIGKQYEAKDGSGDYTVQGITKDESGKEILTVILKTYKGKKTAKKIKCPGKVTLKSGDEAIVVGIKSGAFKKCKKMNTITIPASVTKLEKNQFKGNSKLRTIKIQNKKTLIGLNKKSFGGLKGTVTLKVPKNLVAKYKAKIKKLKLAKKVKVKK